MLISDLFDPAADRAISELAATRCDVAVLHTLSADELDPPIEGDIRLVDRETGDGVDITADLGVLDDYRSRLASWQGRTWTRSVASAASPTCLSPPRCRSPTWCTPSCAGDGSWPEADAMTLLAPLGLLGLVTLPLIVAFYMLRCGVRNGRSARRSCGSTWSGTSRRTLRGSACAARCCC